MSKKKMQKIDLSSFFIQKEDTGFNVLSENEDNSISETHDSSKQNQLLVRKERKGRSGKTVTVIEGYQGNPQTIEKLCKTIKKQCGVGGSVQHKIIIIQGDKTEEIIKILKKEGYSAKNATKA